MNILAPDITAPDQKERRALAGELRGVAGEPVIATESVGYEGLEALVGWDARVRIAEPGVDSFKGMSDEDILNAHPGILAAMAAAQANQMRILDSAIVPDGHLVETRSAVGALRFNEFDVSTPTTAAETFVVWNKSETPEVVTPSSPFYPGLSESSETGFSQLDISLDDDVADPFAMSDAYCCRWE